jgi:uncharacterized repeat protein (TIGR01451 family)
MLKKYYFTILFSICAFYSTFGQCIPPSALTATNITETSAALSWTSVNAIGWQVIILPANSAEPSQSDIGVSVSMDTYIVVGLYPCSAWKFYVSSICDAGTASGLIGPCYFATNSVLATDCPPMAINDAITVYPNNVSSTTSTISVLANDYYMGITANTSNVIVSPLSVPSNFSLNANGTVNVLPGTAPGTYTLTYTICTVQNPSSCSTATVTIVVANEGFLIKAFLDTNSNGAQDSGETNFNLGQFHYQLNNNGITNTVSSSDWTYYIQESNPANLYDLSYTFDSNLGPYFTVSPSSYNDISFVSGSGVTVYNFPITQLPYKDTNVMVLPNGTPPRPRFTYQNRIVYKNSGNQPIASGTVTFTKSNAVSIVSVTESGITSTATGFTYDFTNLLPYETRYIYVTMQVPTIPTVSLGDLLTNTASITIPAGDINISNNSSSLTQTIVGSYDPNDKTESRGEKIVYSSFTSNDYLTYTIQFENTGTFYAENVKITDVLDAKLDETSVKMISSSHSNVLSRVGNTLNWNMNGIDLLPSGKGYVTFQIKPKPGYAIGDIIPNTASIFFDFNPAIITNTFQTEFVNTMSISDFENATYFVYPNPTNSFVTISGKDNSQVIKSVVITDFLGKTVQAKTVNMVTTKIDLSDLSNGIYFAKVKSGNNLSIVKIIKQ